MPRRRRRGTPMMRRMKKKKTTATTMTTASRLLLENQTKISHQDSPIHALPARWAGRGGSGSASRQRDMPRTVMKSGPLNVKS